MTSVELHRLATRFCDSDAMTQDLTADGALEYRMFLSRFLIFVGQQRQAMTADRDDNVLQFNLTKEATDGIPTR